MREYLNRGGKFYHISPLKHEASISANGLKYSQKGICVLRTNDLPIINAVICTQIPEIEDGAQYIIVTLQIPFDAFSINSFEPDILDDTDWTWPFHNIIKEKSIGPQFITAITKHTYWGTEGAKDSFRKKEFHNHPVYLEGLNLSYETHYRIPSARIIETIGYDKYVKAYDSVDPRNQYNKNE